MAKKFFYNKVYNPKKQIITYIIIGACVIGIVICFIITKNINNKNYTIELRDAVSVEINSALPEKASYFKQLSGISENKIKVNTKKVDLSKLGEYDVNITINGNDYTVKVDVIDTTAPNLTLKDVSISTGSTYSFSDFVASCDDNSKEECNISYYDSATDQDGNVINYANYTEKGSYEIQIMAKDSTGNQTISKAKLNIDTPSTTQTTPTSCKYGNLEYDKNNTIAYFVSDNGCALDLNLYHDDNVKKPIVTIADTETHKIQAEVNSLNNLNGTLTVNRNINAVLNNQAIGFVGYSLYIKVTDGDNKTVVSYYLDQDGNRVYDENPYSLK